MEHLYHLSHLFEFLCSVYFGSALLIFIEESIIERIFAPVNEKIADINGVRVLINDYTNMIAEKQYKDVKGRDKFWVDRCHPFYEKREKKWYNRLLRRKIFIEKVKGHGNKSMILKMFFPTFFFTGVYCLTLIGLSAFQYINNNDPVSYKQIDCFFIDLSNGVLLYQLSTLLIIPRLIGRVNYFVIVFCVLITVLIVSGIILLLSYNIDYFDVRWLMTEEHKSAIQMVAVFIAMMPLTYLLLKIAWDISMYVLITGFYNGIRLAFLRSMQGQIRNDIGGVK